MIDQKHALNLAKELAEKLKLPVKVTFLEEDEVERKLTFYFSAPERVDLRKLINDLQDSLGLRVDFMQMGARECAAKMGGVGLCGRPLCCATWLPKPLNVPTKTLAEIAPGTSPAQCTGSCGKLLCCLLYEQSGFSLPEEAKVELSKRREELKKVQEEMRKKEKSEVEEKQHQAKEKNDTRGKKKRVRHLILD